MHSKLDTYHSAIIASFPELLVDTIEYMVEGKDNLICLVNGELIFRFPKRDSANQKLLMEIKLLPELAPTLPVPIPHFSYRSITPIPPFPYAFVGYEKLKGRQLSEYMPGIWQETWWPPTIGAFLTALHRFPAKRALLLGVPGGGANNWRKRYRKMYAVVQERVYPELSGSQQGAIARYFGDFLDNDSNFDFEPVLLHGDLYSHHILLDVDSKQVSGVIDFSECMIGDPVFDIRNAWEPYYKGKRDPAWEHRREFYYKLQPLVEAAFSEEWGLVDVNRSVREQAMEQLAQTWPV